MAGRKRERYKIEPRISVPFMLELEYESKIIKKTISDLRNMFCKLSVHPTQEAAKNIILGSVLNDYVVFYKDISLILL